jgi:ABC-type branched-subunit amino acid transport system substrate-binding protein
MAFTRTGRSRPYALRRISIAIVVACVSLLAAACSSGSSSPTSTSASTSASATATASASTSTSASASTAAATPISVMLEGTFAGSTNPQFISYPEAESAVQAYFTRLDAAGGINGHQVKIITCNDQANPDVAASCAREAVADKVVAVISPEHSANGVSILPILQSAKIAFIDQPFTSPDYTSPVSFTVGSCCAGVFGAAAIALVNHGCKKIGAFDYDIAASSDLVTDMRNALKPLGRTVGAVVVSPTASTFAGTVGAVQSGGYDCMIPAISQTQIVPLMEALTQAGVKITWAQYGASLTSADLKAMSAAGANGSLVTVQWLAQSTDSALMKQLNADFSAANVAFTDITVGGWTDGQLFDLVARSINGDITSATFLSAISKAENLDLGTIPPYSTQHPLTAAGYNRVFDPYAYVDTIQNGKLVPLSSTPINASAAY